MEWNRGRYRDIYAAYLRHTSLWWAWKSECRDGGWCFQNSLGINLISLMLCNTKIVCASVPFEWDCPIRNKCPMPKFLWGGWKNRSWSRWVSQSITKDQIFINSDRWASSSAPFAVATIKWL